MLSVLPIIHDTIETTLSLALVRSGTPDLMLHDAYIGS